MHVQTELMHSEGVGVGQSTLGVGHLSTKHMSWEENVVGRNWREKNEGDGSDANTHYVCMNTGKIFLELILVETHST